MKKAILRKKLAEERGETTITPTPIKVDDIIVKSIHNKEEVKETIKDIADDLVSRGIVKEEKPKKKTDKKGE